MRRYVLNVAPAAWKEIKSLPARIRHRVRDAVEALANDPRPAKSKALELPGFPVEARRLRLDRWRILYAVVEEDGAIDILAVRKRPPYDYDDLETLLKDFPPPSPVSETLSVPPPQPPPSRHPTSPTPDPESNPPATS